MEEAYLIGIRLVLEDGISEGLAAIESELSTLDMAILATAAHLAQLQSAAAAMELRGLTTAGEQLLRHSATPLGSEAPSKHDAREQEPAREPQRAQQLPVQPIAGPPQAPQFSSAPLDRSVEPAVRANGAQATALPEITTLVAAPIVTVVNGGGSIIREAPQGRVAPSTPSVLPPAPFRPATITILAPPPSRDGITERGSKPEEPPRTVSAPQRSGRQDLSERHGSPASELKTRTKFPEKAAPMAPSRPVGSVSAPAIATPLAPFAPSPSSSQPEQQLQNQTPTSGAVFLDGHHVGHWIADHLARETSRPAASTTGFDARLSPSYPGALQGN